jgi:hypothetical protein
VKPAALSVPEILDDTGDLISLVAAPWMGVLGLAALPLRLVQADFVSRLVALGGDASRHGHLLLALAAAAAAAFVLATLGRAVFARACLLAIRTGARPGTRALAVGLTPLLTHLYLALLAEVLFFGLCLTAVAAPIAITLAALAAAVAPLAERPGLLGPLRLLAASGARAGTLLGLQVVFLVALVIAFANVAVAFHAGLWLARAVPGVDLATWAHRLSPTSPRFLLLVAAGALLVIEPFWVAAHVVYVHRLRARETGEDLRAWFERLRAAEAA